MSLSNSKHSRVCAHCGKTFAPHHPKGSQRYCSRSCHYAAKRRPLADRFWEKVDTNGPLPDRRPELGLCWVWTGATNQANGYGVLRDLGVVKLAHRVSHELCIGPIPTGFQIDHLCRNRACVNPQHLEAVTPRENMLRSDVPQAVAIRTGFCKRGHPRTAENTIVYASGCRACRICARERYAQRKQQQKESEQGS